MQIVFWGDSLTAGVPGCSYLARLRRRLPEHTLVNRGRPNDTAVSLGRRIALPQFAGWFDQAFLWVGINDVGPGASWLHGAYGVLGRQQRARHLDEFRTHYRGALAYLLQAAERVVAVAPLLKGEDLDSDLNCQVAAYAQAVEELAREAEGVRFLDLRPAFAARLNAKPLSGYLPHRPFDAIWDALTLRTAAQVDRRSRRRGLHLTLDGLHLNSAGAELVAAVLEGVIREG